MYFISKRGKLIVFKYNFDIALAKSSTPKISFIRYS